MSEAIATGPESPVRVQETARRARVLVIDDDPMMLRALVRTLAGPHDVVGKSRAREALDLAAQQEFDVIFCDLMMPEMNGIELFCALTAVAPRQAEKVVFLTGGACSESMREFLERVPNRTLEKPFDAATLRQLVAGGLD